ncbi:DUF1573 domain-containing protein [Flavitalea sp.]|nr:DUF1573 domain-containing protein [Flavitalea sp.]
MKKLFALLLLASAFTGCKDTPDKPAEDAIIAPGANALTSIEWIEPKKDLGTINEGQKLQISFHLKNTGTAPLVLQSVVPGCGCTVADYPKEPIAPGKEADITASFDSKGREGQQHKEITVTANTKESSQHTLSFNVMVVKAKS